MRLLLVLAACAGSLFAQFRAGAAKTVITPDPRNQGPVYMAGFGHNRVAQSVHDDLTSRCLALSAGRKPLVLCEVDLIGLFLDDVQRIRAGVRAALPREAPDVVVASTHVHEGPDTMGLWGPSEAVSGINEEYMTLVVNRTVEAAVAAVRNLQPATPVLARVKTPELDTFIDDNRPPVVHDPELIVLRVTRRNGEVIATAVNWANHPETLGSRNTQLTSDYPNFLRKRIEDTFGGMAVLWNGAVGGMQSPLGAKIKDPATGQPAPENSFRKAEILGQRVADLCAEAVKSAQPAAIDAIAFREKLIEIPTDNPGFEMAQKAGLSKGRKASTNGNTTVPVGLVRLSGRGKPVLEIALIPGEMYPELSVGGVERYSGADFPEAPIEPPIKSLMQAPYRMLIGLADDEIGYIIPKAEWDRRAPYLKGAPKPWYGEVNSVGPEAAPRIAEAFRTLAQ